MFLFCMHTCVGYLFHAYMTCETGSNTGTQRKREGRKERKKERKKEGKKEN